MNLNISIVGLGLIGGSLAKAIKAFYPDIYIQAYDKEEVLDSAIKQAVINKKMYSAKDAVVSDIVFVALPIEESLNAIAEIAPIIGRGTLVTDVCGVKEVFQTEWNKHNSKGFFIGGHPMTGKEKGGFENSEPLLFENAVYILCGQLPEIPVSQSLLQLLQSIGAKVKFIEAKQHDLIVSKVSHLPQILAVALVNAVTNNQSENESIEFAAGGFRDMTRIASSPFHIWEPVFHHNKIFIEEAINRIVELLEDFKNHINKEDSDILRSLFEQACCSRNAVPKHNKGFSNPVYDLFVLVKDEPGILYRLTSLMYENNINIKDIELLKISEGVLCNYRLSLESEQAIESVKIILKENHFAFE